MRAFLVASGVVAGCVPAVLAQGMMGTTLEYTYMYDNNVYSGPVGITVDASLEMPYGAFAIPASIDITDSQVIFIFDVGSGAFFSPSFNGAMFADVTNNLAGITSVTIDPSSTMASATAARISFTVDSFSYDFAGLSFTHGEILVLNIVTPTPGAAALIGLGGLTALRRRRPAN